MTAARARRARPEAAVIGWREWIGLPGLGVQRIKAKVDTGARSSALHAVDIERREHADGSIWLHFGVQPLQRRREPLVQTAARLHDERWVKSSSGDREMRPVILTEIELGGEVWPIELTLTNRDVMGFRFLLGRQAIRDRVLIDPGRSYALGRPKRVRKPTRKK